MTFPLRLTPFEELFLYDDLPAWPATFFCRVQTTGTIDRELAQQAADRTSRNHPLTHARISMDARGQPCWVDGGALPQIRFREISEGEFIASQLRFDLTTEQPIRIWISAGQRQSSVFFQLHHAAFDGLGSFQLLGEWLLHYHRLWTENNDDRDAASRSRQRNPPSTVPSDLAGRCRIQLSRKEFWRILPGQWRSLRGSLRFLFRKTIPLVPVADLKSLPDVEKPFPQFETLRFDPETTRQLRDAATGAGVTVNTLVLGAVFQALQQWQTTKGIRASGTHFRVMVPVNEREYVHRRMPACNHCTMINIDRAAGELNEAEALRCGLHRSLDLVQRYRLGLNLWRGLAVCRWLPGGIRRRAGTTRCKATAVLTNLGDLSRRIKLPEEHGKLVAGDLVVEQMDLVPPIRPQTALALALFYYAGHLCLTAHVDAALMSREDALRFLAILRQNLEI